MPNPLTTIQATARRTGRTTRSVQAAAFAMCLGSRVLYVCGSAAGIDGARLMALDMLKAGQSSSSRLSITRNCITLYTAEGAIAGMLRFVHMDSEAVGSYFTNPGGYSTNPDGINRGLRDDRLYRVIVDHYAEERHAERMAEQARRNDMVLLRDIMQRHGLAFVDTPGATPTSDNTHHLI